MLKKLLLITSAILLSLSTSALCDTETSAEVFNAQRQTQFTTSVPIGLGQTINVDIQTQQQAGTGISDRLSFAGDMQSQTGNAGGSTLTANGSGICSGGSYGYFNGQTSLTVSTSYVTPYGTTKNISGVVGGMGALTHSSGNAVAAAGGILSNGNWSMTNEANSISKPTSISIDGNLVESTEDDI